ncbi:MAG: hypothetical protein QOC66_2223 [Pseudonocardiales bacterium]|jgi:hypothetical protein|nr:hypothetical protein [Pseudonocardiales bacterium]
MTRVVLVLLCAALVALALAGMRRGWHNRLRGQGALPPLAVVPAELGEPRLSSTGVYVGTTFAVSWQDRVLHATLGERADAVASLYAAGLVIDRQGSNEIFVPRTDWVEARLAPALAGKVMGEGGLLVLRWRLGTTQVDTGFRADDKTTYPAWVRAINGKVLA